MRTLLIIPAYNEEKNILKVVTNIKEKRPDLDYIVIDDGSKDSTLAILKENNIPHIHLIHNLGIGGAVQTGYKSHIKMDMPLLFNLMEMGNMK